MSENLKKLCQNIQTKNVDPEIVKEYIQEIEKEAESLFDDYALNKYFNNNGSIKREIIEAYKQRENLDGYNNDVHKYAHFTINIKDVDKDNNKINITVKNDGCFFVYIESYNQEDKLIYNKSARYRIEHNNLKISNYKKVSRDNNLEFSETADFSINPFVYKYNIDIESDALIARRDENNELDYLSISNNGIPTVFIDKFSKRPRTVFEL